MAEPAARSVRMLVKRRNDLALVEDTTRLPLSNNTVAGSLIMSIKMVMVMEMMELTNIKTVMDPAREEVVAQCLHMQEEAVL